MAPVPARRDVVLLGYAMAAATAAASKERINVSAVPLAPPISFQPLSLCLAYHGFSKQCTRRDTVRQQVCPKPRTDKTPRTSEKEGYHLLY